MTLSFYILERNARMDEMKISSNFTRGLLSKALNVIIRKKTGYNVSVQLNEIVAVNTNGKTQLHLDIDASLSNDELVNIFKNMGLN